MLLWTAAFRQVLSASLPALGVGELSLLQHAVAQSVMVIPLAIRGELIAMLVAGSPDPEYDFTNWNSKIIAEAIANQAATALDNAILFESTDVALAQRIDELAATLEMISQRMATASWICNRY